MNTKVYCHDCKWCEFNECHEPTLVRWVDGVYNRSAVPASCHDYNHSNNCPHFMKQPIYTKEWFFPALLVIMTVIFVMLMLPKPAAAGEVNMLIGSYHLPRDDYCEFNPGIGYTADNGVGALVYRNSECNTGLVFSYTDRVSERVSVSYGGAFGYSYSPIVPFASVQYALGEHAFVGVLPGFLVGEDSVIFYGVKF